MDYKPILKASAYYLEDVLGLKLDKKAQNGQFSFILLNQPPVCDAHCRRCFMPEERRGLGHKEALTLDESKRVLDNAREYGALCLELSGEGEPTLNKNLPQIIEYAHNIGLLTTLITNGHNLNKEDIIKYKDNNVTLVFSHYSLNSIKYESDNGTLNSFQRKMRNLEFAITIFKETREGMCIAPIGPVSSPSVSSDNTQCSTTICSDSSKRTSYAHTREESNCFMIYRLAIHATLQKDNIQDVLSLREYCHKNEIFFSIAPLAQTGCAVNNPKMKLEEKVNINGDEMILSKVPTLLGDNSIIHSHSSARELGREVCGTCFYGLNIGYDGAVLFDAHAGYEINHLLGNVRTHPFEEIIQTRRKISKLLFENIDEFCPVRDSKWNVFLEDVLSGKIEIKQLDQSGLSRR